MLQIEGQPANLGIALFLVGLACVLLAWSLLRWAIRSRTPIPEPPTNIASDLPVHDHAIFLIRTGGGVEYINEVARQILELRNGELPNLETLTRRIQPVDDFYKLCSSEGQSRLTINRLPMQATSYLVPGPLPGHLITMHAPEASSDMAGQALGQIGSTLELLTRFNQKVSIDRGIKATIQSILESIEKLVSADVLKISLWSELESTLQPYYLTVNPGVETQLDEGKALSPDPFSKEIINTRQSLFVADTRTHPESAQLPGIHSYIGFPLLAGNDLVGTLELGLKKDQEFSIADHETLRLVSGQAALAIHNASMLEKEQHRSAQELEQRVIERTRELGHEKRNTDTLLRILTEASSSLDLDRALNHTLSLLNEAIGAEQGTILLLDPESNTLRYRAGYGYLASQGTIARKYNKPATLNSGEGLAGWVIKKRQAVLIGDVNTDKRWIQSPLITLAHRSAIIAPLTIGEDAIGALMVFHRKENYFTSDQLNLVQAIGNQVAVAINNAQLYELIRHQAERLGGMLRNEQVVASRQQAILEAVADGILVTDSVNQINFINVSACRILNLDAEQVVGHPLADFIGLFGKAAQTWMQTIQTWSEDPETFKAGDTYAEQLTLETSRVVLVHLAPVIWRNEFLGTVSIFRDITYEVEVDRLKSEFVATVSHELRTPMTSIKGYVDVLLMGAAGALNENQIHFLDIVRSNTERLNILVNDLLNVSRIESGQVSLSLQPLDLKEIAEDIIETVLRRSDEEKKPIGLALEADPQLPRVLGDVERVRQVLGNLVDNAYHYTPANGQINIRMFPVDGQIQVDVKDNGIGIPPADHERVFDRFYRGEDPLVLATPGTGLGLAIVRQLVKMHKGRIWIKSSGVKGEGSTFSFTLPVYQSLDSLEFSRKDEAV